MAIDFLTDENDDLIIENGDFKIGESLTQEVSTILRMNQGELKSDPLLGANLIQLINSNVSEDELQRRVKIHLNRDGKNYEEIKDLINLKRNIQ
jgi:phage baseplate assembly protein W